MKRIALVALWLAATAATTVIAYIAVNAADAEVNERPSSAVVASALSSSTDTSRTLASPTSGGATNSSATTGGVTSTTAPAASTTDTSASFSSTTTLSAPWQQSTINSVGGLVIVSYRPGEVRLESITPHPGFIYEVKEEGPPEVRVEFEASHLKIEIRAEWDEGLVTEIDEDS